MYTLLNNTEASTFDLFLAGKRVASLHYTFDSFENEFHFFYCESIEEKDTDKHRQELMTRAIAEARRRWLRVNVTCPIGLAYMELGAS
ncbi:hypothetical protein GCM10009689_17530 [Brevibacterium antiquum]